jgi:hypothetical protein
MAFLGLISFAFSLTTLLIGNKNLWPQTLFFRENIGTPIAIAYSVCAIMLSLSSLNFNSPPSKRKSLMYFFLFYSMVLYFFQILGFVTIFSSQLGHSSILIECFSKDSCKELFTIHDYYQRTYYKFKVQVHKSKDNQIILSFFLAAIPLICLFFITILVISFIRRSMNEYNSLNCYEPKVFSVEENGQKVDIDLFEVVTDKVKVNNKGNNNNNEEDKGDEVVIYTRRFKTNN